MPPQTRYSVQEPLWAIRPTASVCELCRDQDMPPRLVRRRCWNPFIRGGSAKARMWKSEADAWRVNGDGPEVHAPRGGARLVGSTFSRGLARVGIAGWLVSGLDGRIVGGWRWRGGARILRAYQLYFRVVTLCSTVHLRWVIGFLVATKRDTRQTGSAGLAPALAVEVIPVDGVLAGVVVAVLRSGAGARRGPPDSG